MSCHDSSPNYIPVGINYNNVTGKATGLAEIRTLDVAEIKPVDGNLIISGSTVEIKTNNLILSSDVDVFIPGNLTVSGTVLANVAPVDLTDYITTSTFNPFSATVNSHIGTQNIHFTSGELVTYTDTIYPTLTDYNAHIGSGSVHYTSGALVAYTDTIYPALTNYNSHVGSGTVHFTSGSLSGYYAASSWVDLNYTDNADFTSHTGSASVHYTSGSLSGYYAASSWVDANYTDNADFASHTGSGSVHFTSGSLSSYYAVSTVVDSRLSGKQNQDPTLDAIANITTGASTLIYFSGTDLAATTTLSDFARNILDDSNASTVRSTIGTVIGTDVQAFNTGLKDLADFSDEGSYAAIPFVGTAGNYIRLETGGSTSYRKILRLYDPLAPALPNILAEPRWEFLYLSSLEDVNLEQPEQGHVLTYDGTQWTSQPGALGFLGNLDTSTTTPSAVSATYDYGSPFVWLFDKNDPKYSGYWGGLNLSSWVNTALRPKLDPVYINTSGDSASAGFYFSSVSSTTVSATTYLNLPAEIGIACSDETTNLTSGTAKATFRMPYAMTLTEVRANVNTAPSGTTLLTVDINKNGSTILSTKITIDSTEKTSKTAATAPVISTSSLADDDEITIDIDSVGDNTAGKGLKVWLIGKRA